MLIASWQPCAALPVYQIQYRTDVRGPSTACRTIPLHTGHHHTPSGEAAKCHALLIISTATVGRSAQVDLVSPPPLLPSSYLGARMPNVIRIYELNG